MSQKVNLLLVAQVCLGNADHQRRAAPGRNPLAKCHVTSVAPGRSPPSLARQPSTWNSGYRARSRPKVWAHARFGGNRACRAKGMAESGTSSKGFETNVWVIMRISGESQTASEGAWVSKNQRACKQHNLVDHGSRPKIRQHPGLFANMAARRIPRLLPLCRAEDRPGSPQSWARLFVRNPDPG